MHELVLVLSDFYVSQEAPERELPAGVTLPGLQQVARFGTRSPIQDGWRPWLSRWLTGVDAGATATVAAATLPFRSPAMIQTMRPIADAAAPHPAVVSPSRTASTPAAGPEARATDTSAGMSRVAWLATPMHLIAGMTSIHVDRRSILRLEADDQAAMAADFQRVFHDSGFHLQPLEAGDFLMLGPAIPSAAGADEPARAMGASMPQTTGTSPALRKLGAEIEMWLHDHAINDSRRRRGEQAVTALWLWGGGPTAASVGANPSGALLSSGSGVDIGTAKGASAAVTPDIGFGRDSYLQGLWATRGAKVAPLPEQVADVFGYPHAQRAVLVIEIGVMLQSNPRWALFEALADIDRRFIAPAVVALNTGQYERLVLLANDYELTLKASDRFKFWRRAPAGLSGLQ